MLGNTTYHEEVVGQIALLPGWEERLDFVHCNDHEGGSTGTLANTDSSWTMDGCLFPTKCRELIQLPSTQAWRSGLLARQGPFPDPVCSLGRSGQSSITRLHSGPLIKISGFRGQGQARSSVSKHGIGKLEFKRASSPPPPPTHCPESGFNHCGIMAFNCSIIHEAADKALEYWAAVPQGAQWALAGVGALYVARRALSFLQLLLNCFILSGTNVRLFFRIPPSSLY